MDFTGERFIIGKAPKDIAKEHLERYSFCIPFVGNMNVLDVACGVGYGSDILSSTAKNVIGVDISTQSIEFAKKNYLSEKVNFHVGDATNMDFLRENSCDVVVSFETIEHIKHYRKFLEEIKRVLKGGGILIISTPNKRFSDHNLEKPLNPYHVIEFHMEQFVDLLKEYFVIIRLYGQDIQTPYKILGKKMIQLIPKKIRQLVFPRKLRENVNASIVSGIQENMAKQGKYIVALCKVPM